MAWDLADTVPLTTEITDAAGDLVAASGVVCTVGLPDGTSVTPAVANPSTGRYTVDFVATMAGRHTERWTSTSPATARSDMFDVRPAEPAYLFSLADAKKHLNKLATGTIDDEELRSFIEGTTAALEDLCGEVVVRRTVVERHRVEGRRFALTGVPVISVTAVESFDGSRTWDPAAWDVDPTTGILTAVSADAARCDTVKVTFVAGYQVIPANYSKAAQQILRHQWSTQREDTNRRTALSAGAGEDFVMTPNGYSVPRSAAEAVGAAMPLVGG